MECRAFNGKTIYDGLRALRMEQVSKIPVHRGHVFVVLESSQVCFDFIYSFFLCEIETCVYISHQWARRFQKEVACQKNS